MNRTNRVYRIAVIPDDGIGKEVVPEGLRELEVAASRFGFALKTDGFAFASCDYPQRHGPMMPEARLRKHAISADRRTR